MFSSKLVVNDMYHNCCKQASFADPSPQMLILFVQLSLQIHVYSARGECCNISHDCSLIIFVFFSGENHKVTLQ